MRRRDRDFLVESSRFLRCRLWVYRHLWFQDRLSAQAHIFTFDFCEMLQILYSSFPMGYRVPVMCGSRVLRQLSSGVQAVEPPEYFRDGKIEFSSLKHRLMVKVKPAAAEEFEQIPFYLYCPSMHEKLKNGICEEFDSYWPSKAATDRHRECHKDDNASRISSDANSSDEEMAEMNDNDKGNLSAEHQVPMPIFEHISEILQGPFTDI